MSQTLNSNIAVVGIDIGKNSFHVGAQLHPVERDCAYKFRERWIPVALAPPASLTFLVHLENTRPKCAFSAPSRHFFG
jgi:hypothetical protein